MNDLKLIKTEKFGKLDCNFYRNNNDTNILITREQIGTALEYINPQKAIDNIHAKHKDRLDMFSLTLKLRGADGKMYNTCLYNQKGIMEICRWSRQKKADKFIDFCWGVIDNLLFNDNITQQIDYSPIMIEINSMKNDIQSIKYLVNRQQPVKQYSRWRKYTTPKIKLLADYFNQNQYKILSDLYIELEDTYNIDLNEYKADYCFSANLDNCSQFDVIENNKQLRDMFDLLIDSLLEKYHLETNIINNMKRKTIFDDIITNEIESEEQN